jgi:hypothetical protein
MNEILNSWLGIVTEAQIKIQAARTVHQSSVTHSSRDSLLREAMTLLGQLETELLECVTSPNVGE